MSDSPRFTGRLVIDSEKMREFLESAWWSGFDCSEHGTDEFFNDWYLEKYDDIIESGTEQPVNKMRGISPHFVVYDEVSEIPPFFRDLR